MKPIRTEHDSIDEANVNAEAGDYVLISDRMITDNEYPNGIALIDGLTYLGPDYHDVKDDE